MDALEKKISGMFLDRFPEVGCTIIGRELNPMEQPGEPDRQQKREQEIKQALIETVKEDPDFFRAHAAALAGN
jgi:hypothetical protein